MGNYIYIYYIVYIHAINFVQCTENTVPVQPIIRQETGFLANENKITNITVIAVIIKIP